MSTRQTDNIKNTSAKCKGSFSKEYRMRVCQSWFILVMSVVGFITPCPVFSAYLEGIDTTDINGFSRDSAFRFQANRVFKVSSIKMISFSPEVSYYSRYFSYAFEDIKKAPDTFMFNRTSYPLSGCFIIQRSKDSMYSKISFLEKLPDGRYLYRYGLNTKPNDLLLIKNDYDRAIRYKPNNLYRSYRYPCCDTIFWEPPIPNNNHLIGYVVYRSKASAIIDTSAPINMAQWDSIAFTDSTWSIIRGGHSAGFYINLVAVYTEGRSDFLQGWTLYVLAVGISPRETNWNHDHLQNKFSIFKTTGGYLLDFKSQTPPFVSIFDLSGRQMAKLSDVTGNHFIWPSTGNTIKSGIYILRAVFPDKGSLSQPFFLK